MKQHPHLMRRRKAIIAVRKKAITAVARQLAVDLWRIRTGRLTPESLGFTL